MQNQLRRLQPAIASPLAHDGQNIETAQAAQRGTITKIAVLALLTLAVLIFRRPDQFHNPYIWVEDGTIILNQYLEHGWLSLFYPVNGYFITPTKLIHALSLTLSFRWYPEISYWLTIAFTITVIATVALAPTALKHRTLCAIGVLLIPTGSEVFAVSEYALWWGGLLLFLPLLWQRDSQHVGLRILLVFIAGLSSALVVFCAPLYLLRTWITRERSDYFVLMAVILTAAIQASTVLLSGESPHWNQLSFSVPLIITKFFGWYVYWNFDPSAKFAVGAAGILCCAVVGFCAWPRVHRRDLVVLLLCAALPLCILASILRAALPAIDPHVTAPRYFFYPYILISWLLIQAFDMGDRLRAVLIGLTSSCMLFNFASYSPWHHSYMDWRQQVNHCLAAPEQMFQIHFQGRADSQWGEKLSNAQCKTLVGSSWFDNSIEPSP